MGCGASAQVRSQCKPPERDVLHDHDADKHGCAQDYNTVADTSSAPTLPSSLATTTDSPTLESQQRSTPSDPEQSLKQASTRPHLDNSTTSSTRNAQHVERDGLVDPGDPAFLVIRRDIHPDELRMLLNAELAKLEPSTLTPSGTSHTVDAQEIMIQRLTADLAEAQATVTKLQDALDRRVRQSRVSLARHRAESELLMGELKEKLAIKTAECDRLKSASDPDSTMGNGGHTALVVSLSQQIADLDAELTEANQEIARLRALQGQQHLTQEM